MGGLVTLIGTYHLGSPAFLFLTKISKLSYPKPFDFVGN